MTKAGSNQHVADSHDISLAEISINNSLIINIFHLKLVTTVLDSTVLLLHK